MEACRVLALCAEWAIGCSMNEAQQVGETPNPASASAPTPVPAQVNASSTSDKLRSVPILPPHLRGPQPAPKVEPLNPTLDEGDLKLSLNIVIDGRSIRIMDCNFTTTACGGLDPKNRGIVFQCLEQLTDQARQAAAIKINSGVPMPEPSPGEMWQTDPGLSDSSVVEVRAQDGANHLPNGAPRY
jgi:hypothetical protein